MDRSLVYIESEELSKIKSTPANHAMQPERLCCLFGVTSQNEFEISKGLYFISKLELECSCQKIRTLLRQELRSAME